MPVYTDKTATALRSNQVVAQLVHAVLLNVTNAFKKVLIDQSYILLALVPLSSPEKDDDEDNSEKHSPSKTRVSPLNDDLLSISSGHACYWKIEALHKVI